MTTLYTILTHADTACKCFYIQYPIFYISFYLPSPATLMRHFIVFAQYHLCISEKRIFTTEILRKNEDISSKAN